MNSALENQISIVYNKLHVGFPNVVFKYMTWTCTIKHLDIIKYLQTRRWMPNA
jgi:hypothetical protein